MEYYFANCIYPQWLIFVKIILVSISAKNKHFAAIQESVRKDVEYALGVLQALPARM